MGNVIKVGMADLNICKAPDSITTLGLGSCVGVALYDQRAKVAGLLHAMLPDSTAIRNNTNTAKFVDTGLDELIRRMEAAGASRRFMVAKIAGGAKMFALSSNSAIGNVGDRNIEAAREQLKKKGIRILAEDTGLNYGRTVELYAENGDYLIKSVGKDSKII